MPRRTDKYANIATAAVTLSAANTLTFGEIITGVSLGTKLGWLIDEIDYNPDNTSYTQMTVNGDYVAYGLTTSSGVTDINAWESDNRVIHSAIEPMILGAAGQVGPVQLPRVFQFFPPLIVAAPKVYLGCITGGLAAAVTCRVRIHYRLIDLTPQEYLEIAEAWSLIS